MSSKFEQVAHLGKARGFSIIELMVAMTLSLLLLGGVITLFTSSRSTYETTDRLARVEENARYALESMVRDVRASGYLGCSHNLPDGYSTVNTVLNTTTSVVTSYDNYSVSGFKWLSAGAWSPSLDTTWVQANGNTPANNSDVLLVRIPRIEDQPVALATSMTGSADSTLYVTPVTSGNPPFTKGQVVMMSNCVMRSFFRITSYAPKTGVITHDASGNTSPDLGYQYKASSSDEGSTKAYSLQTVVYFVAPSASGNGNSLWRRTDVATGAEELVEGIDAVGVTFGIDTDGDGIVDSYVDSSGVTNPSQIVSVQISLLARSLDEYGTDKDTKTYTVLDQSFTAPSDRRLRQLFTTTATVRNAAS